MRIFKDNQLSLKSSVLTIGAFDGIHLGHKELIQTMKKRSKELNLPSVVYTFFPPPRAFFNENMIITPLEEKIELIKKIGVDYLIIANFNAEYSQKSVNDFISELRMLHPSEIWVGKDFKFGRKQSGSIDDLKGEFSIGQIPFVRCPENKIISSTRIRDYIKSNNTYQVNQLLGYEYDFQNY